MTVSSNNNGGFNTESWNLTEPKTLNVNLPNVSAQLALVGLKCPQNNIETIAKVKEDIQSSLPTTGATMLIAAPKTSAKDYEYTIDNSNAAWSKMSVLLANIDKLNNGNIYYVSHNHVENKFESSTIGAIKEAFTAAGEAIGKVQNGHVDTSQITALIGNMIGSLSDSTSNDFNQEDQQILFLIQKKQDKDNMTQAIAGVKYKYKFTVQDINSKKTNKHESYYCVEQWNIVFTNQEVFEETYNKVKGG